ncbi:MAG: glycosyltransferase [Clostridia bacterium]|nr:glycosyltransferase [Clostridia bacterium]
MKKKLLLVIPHLTIGGVQKSLISALPTLDYEKYDVTLYLRKNRTTLLQYVDKRVNVIINEDKTKHYRKPYSVFLQIVSMILSVLGLKEKSAEIDKKLGDFIREQSMKYEYKTYFKDIVFDKAIAYVQGYTVELVDKYVNSKDKYVFFHTSKDEVHYLHEKALPHFKKIAALHEEQAGLVKSWYPEIADRVTIVENFVSRSAIEQQSLEYTVERPENKTVLCSCGRLSPVKGFDIAVESAKLLKDKNTEFLWYFVGDGPERERLEKQIDEYNLSDCVIITGMKENPYPYMKAADIYVQPSYEEALGLTIVEAQKLKKPVVSTATVGGNKLVSHKRTGLVAEISAESLSENILMLIIDKSLYNSISEELNSIDDSQELNKFKAQWKKLLEE